MKIAVVSNSLKPQLLNIFIQSFKAKNTQYENGEIDRPEPEDVFDYLLIFRWPDGIIEEENQDE